MHIPLTFRRRGGRKLVVTPDGAPWAPRPRVDNAIVKALARAFRWRKMLDDGAHPTLEDLARANGVNSTYVSRLLRLTMLAPDVVGAQAILDGRQTGSCGWTICWKGFRWSGRGRKGSSNSCRSSLYDRTRLPADRIGAASGSTPCVLYIQR